MCVSVCVVRACGCVHQQVDTFVSLFTCFSLWVCVFVCVFAADLIKTVNSTQNMLPGETVAVALTVPAAVAQ